MIDSSGYLASQRTRKAPKTVIIPLVQIRKFSQMELTTPTLASAMTRKRSSLGFCGLLVDYREKKSKMDGENK